MIFTIGPHSSNYPACPQAGYYQQLSSNGSGFEPIYSQITQWLLPGSVLCFNVWSRWESPGESPGTANQRPVPGSCDHSKPIRGPESLSSGDLFFAFPRRDHKPDCPDRRALRVPCKYLNIECFPENWRLELSIILPYRIKQILS